MPRDQQHVGCKREQPCQRHLRGRSVVSAGHAGDDRAAEYGVVLIARPAQRAERHESDSHLYAFVQYGEGIPVGEVEGVLHADDFGYF